MKRSLKEIRQEVAVSICVENPSAYEKATAENPQFKDEKERAIVESLKGIMKLEPTVKAVLDTYLKGDVIVKNNGD
jgi:hypothetical protein